MPTPCREQRSPDRQAKIASSTLASSTGEWRRGAEPLRLRRFRVTSPQNSSASEATPASPAMVISTLSTSEAGPRRSSEVPAPCSAEAPMTVRRMRSVTTVIPNASLGDHVVDGGDVATLPFLRTTAPSTLYGRLVVGQENHDKVKCEQGVR